LGGEKIEQGTVKTRWIWGILPQGNFERWKAMLHFLAQIKEFIPQNVSWQKIWFIYMFGFGSMSDLLRDSARYYNSQAHEG
jgi:hypothetical protein